MDTRSLPMMKQISCIIISSIVVIFKILNKSEFVSYKAEIFHTFKRWASFATIDVKSGNPKTISSGMDFSILLWFSSTLKASISYIWTYNGIWNQ
jgi:hypothetical protein